jgi:hypothetical protein
MVIQFDLQDAHSTNYNKSIRGILANTPSYHTPFLVKTSSMCNHTRYSKPTYAYHPQNGGNSGLFRRRCRRGRALAGIAFAGFGSWFLREIIKVDDILGIRLGGGRGLGRNLHFRCDGHRSRRWLRFLLGDLGGLASGAFVAK